MTRTVKEWADTYRDFLKGKFEEIRRDPELRDFAEEIDVDQLEKNIDIAYYDYFGWETE